MLLASQTSNPTEKDWSNVKRILCYLNRKEDIGITYSNEGSKELKGFCDADNAGDNENFRSTSGFIFTLAGGPIAWKSKRQKHATLSSTESESISLCQSIEVALGLRNLALELGIIQNKKISIFCDNQNAIGLANGTRSNHRTRHWS